MFYDCKLTNSKLVGFPDFFKNLIVSADFGNDWTESLHIAGQISAQGFTRKPTGIQ